MPKSKRGKGIDDLGREIDDWMGRTFGGGTDGGTHSTRQQTPKPKRTQAQVVQSEIRRRSISQSSYNRQRTKRTGAAANTNRNRNRKIY